MLYYIKKSIPKPILQVYHFAMAKVAAFLYGNPSNKLIVIGVTGTNGKSSTVKFLAQMLEQMGEKVGYTTTAGFSIAGREIENKMKMTMPGRFYLQSLIKQMLAADCKYAIVETSSEGIKQFRHLGINYDIAVFTNLTPEHIESHGSFENYKKAKGKLFDHLTNRAHKTINDQKIRKTSVINADDEHAKFFSSFPADRKVTFTWRGKGSEDQLVAKYQQRDTKGALISVNDQKINLKLLASFQHKNALAAMAALHALDIPMRQIVKVAAKLEPIEGRFELVDEGQPFFVIVDYAYEPYALQALLEAVKELKPERIIGVHGSAGGGRDKARRPKIGKLAAENEDIVIVTNEDPYDEDPRTIIEEVAAGASKNGKIEGEDLLLINDRTEAIEKAMQLAREGDAVILTGKGSEPVMAVAGGRKAPWSDKQAAIAALKKIK